MNIFVKVLTQIKCKHDFEIEHVIYTMGEDATKRVFIKNKEKIAWKVFDKLKCKKCDKKKYSEYYWKID